MSVRGPTDLNQTLLLILSSSQPGSPFQHGTNRSNHFASKSTIFWRKSDRLLQSGLHRRWKPRWPSEHSHSTVSLPGCSSVSSFPHLAPSWRKKLSTLNITSLFVLPRKMCFNNLCHECCIRVVTFLSFLVHSTWLFSLTACQRGNIWCSCSVLWFSLLHS